MVSSPIKGRANSMGNSCDGGQFICLGCRACCLTTWNSLETCSSTTRFADTFRQPREQYLRESRSTFVCGSAPSGISQVRNTARKLVDCNESLPWAVTLPFGHGSTNSHGKGCVLRETDWLVLWMSMKAELGVKSSCAGTTHNH